MPTPDKATEITRRRYNRIAPFYDFMGRLAENSRYNKWRELQWSKVEGANILEVGVGTGKNFPYYPADAEITAIDFSEKMMQHARDTANQQKVKVHLQQMDVQSLQYADNTFDTVVASFVFCSVPEPIIGLMEVMRVCQPEGKVILLEHVLSANRILSRLMNLANPIIVRMIGANINRTTVTNVTISGLVIEQVIDLGGDIFKLIEARKETPPA